MNVFLKPLKAVTLIWISYHFNSKRNCNSTVHHVQINLWIQKAFWIAHNPAANNHLMFSDSSSQKICRKMVKLIIFWKDIIHLHFNPKTTQSTSEALRKINNRGFLTAHGSLFLQTFTRVHSKVSIITLHF